MIVAPELPASYGAIIQSIYKLKENTRAVDHVSCLPFLILNTLIAALVIYHNEYA